MRGSGVSMSTVFFEKKRAFSLLLNLFKLYMPYLINVVKERIVCGLESFFNKLH